MSEPLSRAELDRMKCDTPGCNATEHDHGPMSLLSRCHPEGGVAAFYARGVLSIACHSCGKLIVELFIAEGGMSAREIAQLAMALRAKEQGDPS